MLVTLQKKLYQRVRVNWIAMFFVALLLFFLTAIDIGFPWKNLVILFGIYIVVNLLQDLLIGRSVFLRTMTWLGPIFDVLFISCVVHFTGGYDSLFGFLYLVPIISSAVLISFEHGIIISLFSSFLFSTIVYLGYTGQIPLHAAIGDREYLRLDSAYLIITMLFNRFLIFFVVAAISGYLAEALKHKMAEADKMKNEFVSLVSHQLKTPLSVFKLYLEELLSLRLGKLTRAQKEYIDEMQRNNENLIWLVSDLLDISRMESGKIQFEPEPTKIDQLLSDTVNRLKGMAEASNCTVEYDNHTGKSTKVFVDPNKLGQAIGNFVSNAIKYSTQEGRSGMIVIDVKKARLRELKKMQKQLPYRTKEVMIDLFDGINPLLFKKKNRNFLLVSVSDNGVGIPEKDQSKIFTKFYRGSNVSVYHTEGTGLGMFISRVIIKGCGGEVWFNSDEGKGTTFYLTIPLKQPDKKRKK